MSRNQSNMFYLILVAFIVIPAGCDKRGYDNQSTRPTPPVQSTPVPPSQESIASLGTFIDLGTLGGRSSSAYSINNRGQIVGIADLSGTSSAPTVNHAFIYENGKMADLGTLGGINSKAYSINNMGQIVGVSDTGADYTCSKFSTCLIQHAFIYESGKMIDLGTLGGNNSEAFSINDKGQIVGSSDTSDGPRHAFLYDGKMIDLGTLGGKTSEGFAINSRGQVVGSAQTTNGSLHAFLFEDRRMIDLGTLGGENSEAFGINEKGQVVGRSEIKGSNVQFPLEHAFLYSNSKLADMFDVGYFGKGKPSNINNEAQVVGQIVTPDGFGVFLYQNGRRIDLNTLLPPGANLRLNAANAINDREQIVGSSTHNGIERAFLITLKLTA